jgi:DNA-binding CsgD family transcriptional regulator
MTETSLIGRDGALGAIRAFLGAVERGPAALVLSGEAGIGKTVLWEEGLAMAGAVGGRVLSCRGIGAEAALSFSGLSDLLSSVVPEGLDSLVPVRRRALEVALLLAEPGGSGPDARAIGMALLDVLRGLSEFGSVLVAVDDLHWLDGASAAALALALRRVGSGRVGFFATVREAPDSSVPFEFERVFPEGRLRRERIGPLDVSSLHRLIRGRLGLAFSRPTMGRIAEASGGNPFFALELARAFGQTGVETEPREPVPVPGSLSNLLGARMIRLPAQIRDVLLVVALAGRPTAELVASVHGDRGEALAALEFAAGEGVFVPEGSRVRFGHPLFASVCHDQAPIWRRQDVHRALAAVVADPEERARHLALAAGGPDESVASELDAAAEHAAARGAPAAAAGLAELAADRTPPGSEDQRRRRRSSAAWFQRLAGDLERACAILEELLVEVPDGPERSDVLYAMATTGRPDMAARVRLCREAALHAAGDDVRLVQILGFQAISRWLHGDGPAALIDAREGVERAERVGDQRLLAMALARVGLMEAWALEVTPGLLERAISIEERLERPLLFHDSPRMVFAAGLLARSADLERAREMLSAVEQSALTRGDEHTRAWVVLQYQKLEYYSGHLQRAVEFSNAAYDVAEQTGELQYEAMVCASKATVEADIGLVDQARATAERGLACSRQIGDEIYAVFNRAALGAVEVGVANTEEAVRHLRELPARLLAMGHRAPGPIDPWPNTIEALIAVGDLEPARGYLEQYEVHAELAASRRALGAASRSRALLAAAEGDHEQASSAIERSLAQLEDARFPLELARTLLAVGSIERQATHKRLARDALLRALAIFEELPAPLWADRARAELRRISGRRPAAEELSESERRIAALAADGRTNKQIAAALYLSVRTVETHLSHIYRKLGVRSRAELAARGSAKAADSPAKVP